MHDIEISHAIYNIFILFRYKTGERSEPENFEMGIQKYPLIMPKILKSEMYIFKFPGGGGSGTQQSLNPFLNLA